MIYLKDNLRFQNVVSKKYNANYKEIDKCIESFSEELKKDNIEVKGPFFTAIYDVHEEGPVEIELFVPLYSSRKVPEGMNFHSYYSVEHMASSVVKGNLEQNAIPTLFLINTTIDAIGCKAISPAYFVYENLFEQNFFTIKVAYLKDENKEQPDEKE